ncbi:hypothetical protein TNCV_5126491 [Trichonephila clavipes]|nr:hypothetical protein TNCV_5126491 [Trichonephila clavipes]
MSRLQKRHVTQNHFCLDVAGLTIRSLVLVTIVWQTLKPGIGLGTTPVTSVGVTKVGKRLICPRTQASEFEPSTAENPPCREAMHVKSVERKGPPVGEVWKLGEDVPAQMSSSSLDLSSKLRIPSPKTLE